MFFTTLRRAPLAPLDRLGTGRAGGDRRRKSEEPIILGETTVATKTMFFTTEENEDTEKSLNLQMQ
jgi:hypothetical protein